MSNALKVSIVFKVACVFCFFLNYNDINNNVFIVFNK